jgi:phage terminase small subunit
MPRQSVEAKAGARFRARPKNALPQPPEHLSQEARGIWARVLSVKPADWFDEGNLPILAQYCDLVAEQAKMVLRRDELDQLKPIGVTERTELIQARLAVNRAIREHAATSAILAAKLRLTVQNTIDRRSGVLTEK